MSDLRILVVDDEIGIVRACQRVLRRTGLEVVTTTSANEALELCRKQTFAVVVSDQRMPEMEGTELLEQIRGIQPDAVRIILTGYADISAAVDAINLGAVYRFLNKPWNDDQLRTIILQAVGQYSLVLENRRLQQLTVSQNRELKELNESLETRVIERTQQVTDLSGRLDATLKGALTILTQLMDVSSSTIGHHSRRVAELSVKIARRLDLDDDELRQIEVAALLHDIGKLMLPSHVVCKDRSSLSREDRAILEQHAVRGEAIAKAIPYLDKAASYVRHHHERVNGSGYPDQLKGDSIPLGARIIAVADAWDKKLNNRKDFQQQTTLEVLGTIRSHAGEIYDKNVFSALEFVLRDKEITECETDDVVDVSLADLEPGMVLAADIRTDAGALLLPVNATLTGDSIRRLSHMEHINLVNGVAVRRNLQPEPV